VLEGGEQVGFDINENERIICSGFCRHRRVLLFSRSFPGVQPDRSLGPDPVKTASLSLHPAGWYHTQVGGILTMVAYKGRAVNQMVAHDSREPIRRPATGE
jgi:hypothetical protein